MLDKFVEGVPNLLADILAEQRRTTEAVTQLAEALASLRNKTVTATQYAEQKAITAEPELTAADAEKAATAVIEKAKAVQPAPKVAEQPAVIEKAKAVQPAPKVAEQPAEFDYAATAKRITDLAGAKGRDIAVGILQKFSAKTLKDIPVEKYAEVIAACDEALA